jgi:small subunit ribosomal protein S36
VVAAALELPARIAPDGSASPERGRPPRAVWLATALFAMVGALWTVALPMFRAPDEAAHLDLVLYLAEGHAYPSWDGRYLGRAIGVADDRHLVHLDRPWPRPTAENAPPRADRQDVEDRGGTEPDVDARTPNDKRPGHPHIYNQMPQHPPLYYQAMATLLRAERALLPGDGIPSLDRELGLLRLANVLMVAPLPLLAWATARRLGMDDRAGTVAALLPLGLPQLTHIGAALNNDNLLTLLGGVLTVLVVGVARGRRSWPTDLAIGLVVGLALLTKAFAVVFVPAVAVAYAACAWTATRRRRQAVAGVLLAGTTSAALGAWWWVGIWIREGQPAPTTESLTRTARWRPLSFDADPVQFAWTFAGRLLESTWAWVGYGTPKFVLPRPAVGLLTIAVAAAVIAAVRAAPGKRSVSSGPRRLDLAVAAVATALVLLFVVIRSWGLYVTYGRFAFIQGRYLFSTLVGPMAIVAFGAARVLSANAVSTALGLVATLQVWMLTVVVSGAWGGSGPFGPVESALAWSPWPPTAVAVVAVAAAATACLLVREARAVDRDGLIRRQRDLDAVLAGVAGARR